MTLSIISLIVLVAVIVLAYIGKMNIGLLALAVAIILARIGGVPDSTMYSGINLNVFWTLLGIYFFGQCMTTTGTLSLLAKKIISKLPVTARSWPIICFVFTMGFALIGPTAILALTIVPLVTIEIAGYCGANVRCSMVMTLFGGLAGRMTPLGGNLSGMIAIADGYGFTEPYLSRIFFLNHMLVCAILAVIWYIIFRGWKTDKKYVSEVESLKNLPKFDRKQWTCLITMLGFILFYAFSEWHIGFVAIICTVVLVALKCVDEKDVIDKTKWGTLIMVVGSGVLASTVQELGGITLISNFIGWVSNTAIVASLYNAASGILSMFTHAMSVPIPILMATVEETVGNLGGSRELMLICLAAIGSGAYIGMSCPMSLCGANVLACWTSVTSPTVQEQQKEFGRMIVLAIVSVLMSAVISFFTLRLFL